MKVKVSNILIGCGIVSLLSAAGLFAYNQYEDSSMGKASETALEQVQQAIENQVNDTESLKNVYSEDMVETKVEGNEYIGYVSIPAIDRELPVISHYEQQLLKIAPCRYTGSIMGKDMVIAAHNSNRHFGRFPELKIGDYVYFTDMNGITYSYVIEDIEVLSPYSVEEMTASGYDLTLFTCTYDAQNRVTLRCTRTNE